MTPLLITIPGIARGKGRPRFGNGRAYTDSKTLNAEAWIKACAVQQVGQPCLQGALELRMVVTSAIPASWPRKRRQEALEGTLRPTGKPDCDNYLKMVDALNGVVWIDDSQLVDVSVSKRYGEVPGTVIEVKSA
jgi:Holliday junction resolvase RusA-like endonuclease